MIGQHFQHGVQLASGVLVRRPQQLRQGTARGGRTQCRQCLGHLEVRQVFKVSRIGNIAGCFCTDGHVQRGSKIRLIRDGRVVSEDIAIESLKRLKDDVREVKAGFECGVKLAGYDDIKTGDVLEAYIRETFQRTL